MSVPRVTNCPNCGAPIDSDKCPYCGTRLVNIADLEIGEPIWLIFNDHGNVPRGVRVRINHVSTVIKHEMGDYDAFYMDNEPLYVYRHYDPTISIEIEGTLAATSEGVISVTGDPTKHSLNDIREAI